MTIKKNIDFEFVSPTEILLKPHGKLDQYLLSEHWSDILKLQSKYQPEILTIDLVDVSDCDSLGAVLIIELKKRQINVNHKFGLINSNDKLDTILAFLESQRTCYRIPECNSNFIARTGGAIVASLKNLRENIIFLGMIVRYIARFFFKLPGRYANLRWQDFWRAMYTVGPQALPIMMMLGFLIGLISTFQSAEPLGRFGAQIYIIDLVGLGLLREIGPLITAVLIAGRTASAFAAEIGTMKVNQEIDALTTMGIQPIRFLLVPRIIATTILTPFLSLFFMFSALVGCSLVMSSLGYGFNVFIAELTNSVTLTDFFSGMVKTFVFGIVIASVGCLHGIKTGYGASAVGRSTTQAVVSSLIMLVFVDGIFATIYYYLGI